MSEFETHYVGPAHGPIEFVVKATDAGYRMRGQLYKTLAEAACTVLSEAGEASK